MSQNTFFREITQIQEFVCFHGIFGNKQPTIAALFVDFSRNRLFHRKLAVGTIKHAHGGCHLRRKGGGFFALAIRPRIAALPLLSAEDVAIVRLLAFSIGVQWSGSIPQLPKSGSCLPFVCIKRAGKVEKSCICKKRERKTRVIGEINAETWLAPL